jgi:hypothetical protein
MDLENMKKIWQEQNKVLEEKISLNEARLQKMDLDKAVKKVDWLFNVSVLGRNLALVYAVISIVFAFRDLKAWEYSIPALVGALAMIMSFVSHLRIRRPDYTRMSVVELQKNFCAFRIHTANHAWYDALIVILWVATLLPSLLRHGTKIDFYRDTMALTTYAGVLGATIVGCLLIKHFVYDYYNIQLKESEALLEQIAKFENAS